MNDDLFLAVETPKAGRRRGRRKMATGRKIGLIFALGCVVAMAVALSLAVRSAREAARRSQCICNLCGITMGLINYHETYGVLPPAHVDDAHGKPMHSWRTLILASMEQRGLYNAYNFNEPWDSPGNLKLLPMMPNSFACPSRPDVQNGPTSLSSYVVVTGPGTAFPDGRCVRFADVKDGTASTLFVVEVSGAALVPWTSPRDLDIRSMSFRVNDPRRASISSWHPGGANVSFLDYAKKFLRDGIAPRDLKALLTIDGGEAVDVEAAISRR